MSLHKIPGTHGMVRHETCSRCHDFMVPSPHQATTVAAVKTAVKPE